MLKQIQGLHHVTSIASDPQRNSDFFTKTLGLRRVKKTVNFDRPDVYHLYYGNGSGAPGSVMTYFPFPGRQNGSPGTGEVSAVAFTVPSGSLGYWEQRLIDHGVRQPKKYSIFNEKRLVFRAPDGDFFVLTEMEDDPREPWTSGYVPSPAAIRGFHSVGLRVAKSRPTVSLLKLMGYQRTAKEGSIQRFVLKNGNQANILDLETLPHVPAATQGAGSVHHVAFSVKDQAAQQEARAALIEAGYDVTQTRDRDYFKAIYFRCPGGILFEIATEDPGFDADEALDQLGSALKLPKQHEHLRPQLERSLQPIVD